jgi:hypothetical protein
VWPAPLTAAAALFALAAGSGVGVRRQASPPGAGVRTTGVGDVPGTVTDQGRGGPEGGRRGRSRPGDSPGAWRFDAVLVVRVDAVAQPPQRALDGGEDVGRVVRSLDRYLREEVVREDR